MGGLFEEICLKPKGIVVQGPLFYTIFSSFWHE